MYRGLSTASLIRTAQEFDREHNHEQAIRQIIAELDRLWISIQSVDADLGRFIDTRV